ncbi:MAG: hypothetical protein AAFO01_12155 [Pseudomonadota bacterium]
MIPLVGALLGGGASSILGSSAAGGFFNGLLGSLTSGSNGGLFGMLSSLFGGAQPSRASEQTQELLVDIKDMLGQLLDRRSSGDGCHDCHRPMPDSPGHGCHAKPEPEGGANAHDCRLAADHVWDGADKSPSLDRERGAARLLDQAKETDDMKDKRELIKLALEMLKEGDDSCGCDGESYDDDIVEQAQAMLEKIDESCLSDCGKNKAMGQVIDMLAEEGGVDGKPAEDSGPDYHPHDYWSSRPLHHFHTH